MYTTIASNKWEFEKARVDGSFLNPVSIWLLSRTLPVFVICLYVCMFVCILLYQMKIPFQLYRKIHLAVLNYNKHRSNFIFKWYFTIIRMLLEHFFNSWLFAPVQFWCTHICLCWFGFSSCLLKIDTCKI